MNEERINESPAMYPLLIGGVNLMVSEGTIMRFASPETKPEELVSVRVKGVTFEVAHEVIKAEGESYLGALMRFHPNETTFVIMDAEPKYFPVVFHCLNRKHNWVGQETSRELLEIRSQLSHAVDEQSPVLKDFDMTPEDSRGIDKLLDWLMPRPQPPVPNAIPSMFDYEPGDYHLTKGGDLLVLTDREYGYGWPDRAYVDPVLVAAFQANDLKGFNERIEAQYDGFGTVDSFEDISLEEVPLGTRWYLDRDINGGCSISVPRHKYCLCG